MEEIVYINPGIIISMNIPQTCLLIVFVRMYKDDGTEGKKKQPPSKSYKVYY